MGWVRHWVIVAVEGLRHVSYVGVPELRAQGGEVVDHRRNQGHRDLCFQQSVVQLCVRPLHVPAHEIHHGIVDFRVSSASSGAPSRCPSTLSETGVNSGF